MTILEWYFLLFEFKTQVIGGRVPDGKNIVNRARLEANQFKGNYGVDISGQVIIIQNGLTV
jgi:hypothetical protein